MFPSSGGRKLSESKPLKLQEFMTLLRRAKLSGARLIKADLSRVDLSGALLIESDLSGADLRWADQA